MTDLELARRLIELKSLIDILSDMPLVGMMEALTVRAAGAATSESEQEHEVAAETVAMTVAYLNEVASIARREIADG